MSTYYMFKFEKTNRKKYCKELMKHELRPKKSSDRARDNKAGVFCVGDSAGNGAWIHLDTEGDGTITRYAGTSAENLICGFKLLASHINATNLICEYDLYDL